MTELWIVCVLYEDGDREEIGPFTDHNDAANFAEAFAHAREFPPPRWEKWGYYTKDLEYPLVDVELLLPLSSYHVHEPELFDWGPGSSIAAFFAG